MSNKCCKRRHILTAPLPTNLNAKNLLVHSNYFIVLESEMYTLPFFAALLPLGSNALPAVQNKDAEPSLAVLTNSTASFITSYVCINHALSERDVPAEPQLVTSEPSLFTNVYWAITTDNPPKPSLQPQPQPQPPPPPPASKSSAHSSPSPGFAPGHPHRGNPPYDHRPPRPSDPAPLTHLPSLPPLPPASHPPPLSPACHPPPPPTNHPPPPPPTSRSLLPEITTAPPGITISPYTPASTLSFRPMTP
ncbi:hypothetical protein EV356DRAFT_28380 [Viridothelium virens]|uniref:Uncharacterized protein n=1 Tax=Viridothelium virens TaxID=1048519 RepID=A0A6A6HGX1_VIRVR|nr:hypothetical protein EV356DRAFT_28380 [Viridothelium virens]